MRMRTRSYSRCPADLRHQKIKNHSRTRLLEFDSGFSLFDLQKIPVRCRRLLSCAFLYTEVSRPYFQASGLRQIDLILVEGQQLSCFEMDCGGEMKNIQQSVASGYCET